MKISLSDLGERMQMLRKAMNLSQRELATALSQNEPEVALDVNQNQISRFENGIGGSLDIFLLLLNFYTEHFHLHSLFSTEFDVVKKSEMVSQMSTFNSIAVERLKVMQADLGQQLTDVIGILERENSY